MILHANLTIHIICLTSIWFKLQTCLYISNLALISSRLIFPFVHLYNVIRELTFSLDRLSNSRVVGTILCISSILKASCYLSTQNIYKLNNFLSFSLSRLLLSHSTLFPFSLPYHPLFRMLLAVGVIQFFMFVQVESLSFLLWASLAWTGRIMKWSHTRSSNLKSKYFMYESEWFN